MCPVRFVESYYPLKKNAPKRLVQVDFLATHCGPRSVSVFRCQVEHHGPWEELSLHIPRTVCRADVRAGTGGRDLQARSEAEIMECHFLVCSSDLHSATISISQDHLLRDDDSHSGLGPPLPHQSLIKTPSQTCLWANLLETSSLSRLPPPRYRYVKISRKPNYLTRQIRSGKMLTW